MKTQISRWSDEPRKRRAGLYQQQGRMVLDADWNELTELLKRRIDDALGEVVGSGAPRLPVAGLLESGTAGGTPLIKRANLYVEGVRATLQGTTAGTASFALTQQADFPAPPPWPPVAAQNLYADVWERSTTALEDASLLDPGLHGADTATRTQTVAQIKWCPANINPVGDARNPSKGDALCKLEMREGTGGANPCDPLASAVVLDALDNYTFRLEVHDVVGPAQAPTEVTLKWSSENAAEQHAQANVPAAFKRSDYIYEFYNSTTEQHLGVHLANNFAPSRAVLREGWPTDAPDPAVFPWVRRWDGYVVLVRTGSTWTVKVVATILQGRERGRALAALPAGGTPAVGSFSYVAPDFTLHLASLKLTLTLDAKKFVAGDYWLSTVREDAIGAARVQTVSLLPLGITHRYVMLGTATGAVVQALADVEQRRLGFPRLADLSADRIAYSATAQAARWTDIIDDTAVAAPLQVQRALDLLAERFDSSDLACTVSGCGTATAPTVRSLLNIAAGAQKLDVIVNRLLCDLNATHLPIDKGDVNLPPLLNVPEVASTQQALSRLGSVATQARLAATVGPGGQFATLTDAFNALAAADDVSLALLPGVHALTANVSMANKRTIRITGAGAYASRINLSASLQFAAREVVLNDVAVVAQGRGHVILQADRVVARNNGFARITTWSPHVWSKRFGSIGSDQGNTVVVDGSGNVIVAGVFAGTVNFGGTDLTAVGTSDVFVAKFDGAGTHVWSKRFGGAADDRATCLAVDGSGNVLMGGAFSGTINFGGTDLVSVGSAPNIFAVKLDAAGAHVWSQRFGSGAGVNGLATDSGGNVLLTGFFSGSINFGGSTFNSATGGSGNVTNDLYIAKLGPTGTHVWSKAFGGAINDSGAGIAIDANNNVLITGSFGGTINFGGGALVGQGTGSNVLVLKLDSSGTHVWSQRFGDPTSVDGSTNPGAFGTGLVVDAGGDVFITGIFNNRINFGGGELVCRNIADVYLAKLSAASGAHLWSKRLLTGALGRSATLAMELSGNLTVAGAFGGTENFGGGDLVSAGLNDIFLLQLDRFGNHLWSRRYGGTNSEQPLGVALDAAGNLVVAGLFSGTLNFGGANLVGSASDVFLAKLTPEPALNPLVTVRPRDVARGTDLAWSQNDMLVSATESGSPAQPRTALAVANHTVGGSIVGNTINGRLLLLSELPLDLLEPVAMAAGTTSVGGGAYLAIRDNHVGRIASRQESTAPNLDAFRTLLITGNTLAETGNAFMAETLTLSNNHVLTRAAGEVVGFAAARQLNATGNQVVHGTITLRVFANSLVESANAFTFVRPATPAFQANPVVPWFFGGVGADLV